MKKLFIAIFCIFWIIAFSATSIQKAQAQLSVTQGAALNMTPLQLIQQVLVGTGVTVSNATFNGSGGLISSTMIGSYTTSGVATSQLGFTGGVLIASGDANIAVGPNTLGSAGTSILNGSDPDLQMLIPSYSVEDKAVLEFDFVPISDTIKFRYVFASEEFDEFCNSSFNDVFGFFVSGPGITGPFSNNAMNIALMPGSSNYVTIDNVCACSSSCSWLNTAGTYYQHDRLTNVYTAWCIVQPCQQYHLKLAIGDAGDGAYDSGVFLEANSLTSSGLSYNTSYSSNVDTMGVEGCNNAIIVFHLSDPAVDTIIINYTVSGTAIEGVDYPDIPDSLIILPGQDSVSFTIVPISDGLSEPAETVYIAYVNTVCGSIDTITVTIKDYTPLSTTVTPEVHNCNGQAATVSVTVAGGFTPPPLEYEWSESAGNTQSVQVNPPTPTMYYVTVSDACNYFTVDSVFVSISNLSNQVTNVDSVTCFGYTDGSATITAVNGLVPYHYIWSPTNDTIATASNLAAGTYFVTVTDDIGCSSTNFVILDSPPEIGLILTPTDETCITYCNGVIASLLTGNYDPPVTYIWNTIPAQSSPNATSLCPGDYAVTVTYSPHNCVVSGTGSIITSTLISADFTADSVEGFIPLTVHFTYTGSGANVFLWDFGDGTPTSTDQNPVHVYEAMGIYYAKLIVSSGMPNFCEDEHQIKITVLHPSSLVVPNIFTPNGDGTNDIFQVEAEGIQSIEVSIFNRWGKKVYETSVTDFAVDKETKDLWDGTSKSEGKCADGTYFYILDAVGYDKKEYNMQGTISLLR